MLRCIPTSHLSLPLYTVSFMVQTLGMALQDAHGNTFVSSENLAHRWLGFIHASYAAGTLAGPPVATAIASLGGDNWTRVYLVLLGLGVLNLVAVVAGFSDSFWRRRGGAAAAPPSGEHVEEGDGVVAQEMEGKAALREMRDLVSLRAFWTLGLFYFLELGAWMTASGASLSPILSRPVDGAHQSLTCTDCCEVRCVCSTTGWVVEYLVKVRSGELSQMGYVPTGWNGGMLLGRILLAEPTFRLGERRMLLVYSVICTGMQLVFWLVSNIIASATALSVMGFFFGPFFATVRSFPGTQTSNHSES